MSLPLILLICLSVFHLCLGTQPEKRLLGEENEHLLGGWIERSPESKDVQKAAQYAVEMYNQDSEDKMLFKLVSVHSAQYKITNMLNFDIVTILGRTECLKPTIQELESCAFDKQQLKCQFFVTLKPRNRKYELEKKKCHNV